MDARGADRYRTFPSPIIGWAEDIGGIERSAGTCRHGKAMLTTLPDDRSNRANIGQEDCARLALRATRRSSEPLNLLPPRSPLQAAAERKAVTHLREGDE